MRLILEFRGEGLATSGGGTMSGLFSEYVDTCCIGVLSAILARSFS
jgi:hypothetical protein